MLLAETSTLEIVLMVISALLGIGLTAGLPWAFIVERRLARIEASLNIRLSGLADDDARVELCVTTLGRKVDELANKIIHIEATIETKLKG